MVLIGKTAGQRYLGERGAMVADQHLRSLNAPVKQNLIRRLSRALAEAAKKVRCAKSCLTCQFIQAYIVLKVRLNEFEASAQNSGRQTTSGASLNRERSRVMVHEIAGQRRSYAIQKKRSARE